MKTKKIMCLFLVIAMALSSMSFAYAADEKPAYSPAVIDFNGHDEIGANLFEFFEDFVSILETGDISNFEAVTSDANTYLLFKDMSYKHDFYETFHNGISGTAITQFLIKEVEYASDQINVIVYVSAKYTYNGSDVTSIGSLYRVGLRDDNVTSLDTTSIDSQILKDTVMVRKAEAALRRDASPVDDFAILDTIFSEKTNNLIFEKQAADEMKSDTTEPQNTEETDPQQSNIMPFAVSVSYSASTARDYGYWLGNLYDNYIFKRASLDCTNFVSQCIWAGYGGTKDYTISSVYLNASATNSTAVALKKRVAEDYRQVSGSTGWYGRNYDSPYGDPVSSFCGVPSLWDWVTANTGNGPKATGYNNGNVYTSLSTPMKQGDVLQFYSNDAKRWYHSVIVVTTTDYSVSNYTSVRVAAHESEYDYRPLDELIQYFGGSACKMRLLRFGSTTFVN